MQLGSNNTKHRARCRRTLCILALGLALLACGRGFGQEGELLPPPRTAEEIFWEVRQRAAAAAAAQLVMERNPFAQVFLRIQYHREQVWPEAGFIGDEAPELDNELLGLVRDGTPMPKVVGKLPDELRRDQMAIYRLYNQALIHSFNAPLKVFIKSAQENKHVTFAHLWSEPDFYRGKVIPVQGRLKRLRQHEATDRARSEGVQTVYEGWIFGPTRGSTPFWVMFTILPDGLQPAEDMDRHVEFYGYFLKKMRYPTSDKKGIVEAPFLIGPTVILTTPPAAAPAEQSGSVPIHLFFVAVGLVGSVTAVLVFLSWWFKRGDRVMQDKLLKMRLEQAQQMVEDASAGEEPRKTGISD